MCCNSVCGAGLVFLKRRNASSTSGGAHGFGLPDFRALFLAGWGIVLRAMKPV
jgi:hypothetical protein